MKRTLTALTAAARSLALVAGAPAYADTEAEVRSGMAMLDIDVVDTELTEEQILEIKNVLNGGDDNESQKDKISKILGRS